MKKKDCMMISEKELEKNYPTLKNKIDFALNNGGDITIWKLGDGFLAVINYNTMINMKSGDCFTDESSDSCILLALTKLCVCLHIDFNKLYESAYPGKEIPDLQELEEWAILYQLPEFWNKKNVKQLMEDLRDGSFSSLIGELKYESTIEKIMVE